MIWKYLGNIHLCTCIQACRVCKMCKNVFNCGNILCCPKSSVVAAKSSTNVTLYSPAYCCCHEDIRIKKYYIVFPVSNWIFSTLHWLCQLKVNAILCFCFFAEKLWGVANLRVLASVMLLYRERSYESTSFFSKSLIKMRKLFFQYFRMSSQGYRFLLRPITSLIIILSPEYQFKSEKDWQSLSNFLQPLTHNKSQQQ